MLTFGLIIMLLAIFISAINSRRVDSTDFIDE